MDDLTAGQFQFLVFPAKTKLEFPGEVKAEVEGEQELKASVGEASAGSDDLEMMPEEEEAEKEREELLSEKSDEEQNVSAMEVE